MLSRSTIRCAALAVLATFAAGICPARAQTIHTSDITVALSENAVLSNPVTVPAGLDDATLLIVVGGVDGGGPTVWNPDSVTFGGQRAAYQLDVGANSPTGVILYTIDDPSPTTDVVTVTAPQSAARLFVATALVSDVNSMNPFTSLQSGTTLATVTYQERFRIDEHMLVFSMYNDNAMPGSVQPSGGLMHHLPSGNGYSMALIGGDQSDTFSYTTPVPKSHRIIALRLDNRPPTRLTNNRGLFQTRFNAEQVVGLCIGADSNAAPSRGPRLAGAIRRTWPVPMVGDCFAGRFTDSLPSSFLDGVMAHYADDFDAVNTRVQLGQPFNNGENDAAVTETVELLVESPLPDGYPLTMIGIAPQFDDDYALGRWYGDQPMTARTQYHIAAAPPGGPVSLRARAGATTNAAQHATGQLFNETSLAVPVAVSSPETIDVVEFTGLTVGADEFPTLSWQATGEDTTGLVMRVLQHQLYNPAAADGLDLRLIMTRDGGGLIEFATESGGPDGGVSDAWLTEYLRVARWPDMFFFQWGHNDHVTVHWQDDAERLMDRLDAIYAANGQPTPLYVYCAIWWPQGELHPQPKFAEAADRLYTLSRFPQNTDRMVFVNGYQLMRDAGDIGSDANVHFNSVAEADLWGDAVWNALMAPVCPWDCAPPGGNGQVNIDDIFEVIQAFTTQNLQCDIAPENPDGTIGNNFINIDDLLAVINNFGPCP